MFHMLTCFNLKPEFHIDEFRQVASNFTTHMKDRQLVHSMGPIGRRQSDTILDTDDERDQEYFFIMSFQDRAQSDLAVELIQSREEPEASTHNDVNSMIADYIFICWEDL
jgi:hypothetical protein